MNSYCFTLAKNESEEFLWNHPKQTIVQVFDMDMAVREFKSHYPHDLREIGYYEGENSSRVVYSNNVDGAEIAFDIE